ncbi:MAG: hypothetical protein GY811_29195 [Myxococcales bacterium]|nr:hypothetical protein [Myxococcales bacterium]
MSTLGWLWLATLEHLVSWRTRIWATLLATFAIALSRLPLFGVLGFEFCLVMAVAASVAGADLGCSLVWRARTMDASRVSRTLPPSRVFAGCLLGASVLSTSLLLAPLLIISAAGIWARNCDWLFGLRCFLLMPVLSAALAGGLGVCAGIIAGRRRSIAIALPSALLLVSTLWSLLHFYRAPAVFSYNPFAGYFPGNLYDESIDLRAPFYWARLFHLSLLASIGALLCLWLDPQTLRLRRRFGPSKERWRGILVSVSLSLIALVLYSRAGKLGFSVDAEDVKAALPGRFESEHFVIHYPASAGMREQIETIARDHEFRRAQLVRDLGVDPPGKITSFYFESPEQKHRLIGARNVYMAKPWRHEIYLNHQEFPHQVLRHEIAHVLAGQFGDPIFSVSAGRALGLPVFFNIGLIEGIAVAADWPDHFNKALTPHQSVKAMQELGMAQPVERLFSTGFLSLSSAHSYTLAGSYLRFLLDRYGIAKLRAVYENGGDFSAAYGVQQSELTAAWRKTIQETELPNGAAQIIRERFRRKAVFDRPCPHAIARARDDMAQDVARGQLSAAISTARSVCTRVPGEPRYQLHLAKLLQSNAPSNDKHGAEAQHIYSRIASDAETTSSTLRAHAYFELISLAMGSGETAAALAILDKLLTLPLADDNLRRAQVMRQILRHTGPAASALQAIFWQGNGADIDRLLLVGLAAEAALLEPDLGLSHYLLARQMRGRGSPKATVRAMQRALALPLSPLVQREAARILAEAAYLGDDLGAVRDAAAILVGPSQPQVTRLLGYDWLERAYWRESGDVPPLPLGWVASETLSGMPEGASLR